MTSLPVIAEPVEWRLGSVAATMSNGGVSERPKERASKARDGLSHPWVQIPPPPPCDVSGHRNSPNLRFVGSGYSD